MNSMFCRGYKKGTQCVPSDQGACRLHENGRCVDDSRACDRALRGSTVICILRAGGTWWIVKFGLALGGAAWPGGAERRNSAVSDGFRHRGVEMGGRRTCWCNGECSGWAVVQVIYRERREVKEKRLGVVPITRALESTANSPCF